jgi:pilus assembly protein TadC
MINNDELILRIQALADNELPEDEIPEVLNQIEGSYEYRDLYINLLQVKSKTTPQLPELSEPVYRKIRNKTTRALSTTIGIILFLGSYLLLFAYFLFSVIVQPQTVLLVRIVVGIGAFGGFLLLLISLIDRIKEKKTDKYKDILS